MDVRYTTHREILDTTPEEMHFDFPFLIHTDTHPNSIGSKLLSLHPEAEVVSFAIKPAHFSDIEIYSVSRECDLPEQHDIGPEDDDDPDAIDDIHFADIYPT